MANNQQQHGLSDNDHAGMNDQQFVKNFGWMLVGFVILTVALMFLGVAMAKPVMTKLKADAAIAKNALVLERVEPEGKLQIGAVAAVAAAPAAELTGEQVYSQACAACHAAGVAGAPKFGDKGAWADRISQGLETLAAHAIEGYQGKAGYMPPKGGNAALTDDQVKDAVVHMVDAVK